MSSLPELKTALHDLVGSRVTDIGRTLDMVELGFDKGGKIYRLHVLCSLRVVSAGQILVGTTDLSFPQDRQMDPAVAYESRKTRYDRATEMLTARFQGDAFDVVEAEMADSGSFAIETTYGVRFEAIPTCSGPMEAWRLFVKGDLDAHYVYPESSEYDGYPDYADGDWPVHE
jgi:hypothetical protein